MNMSNKEFTKIASVVKKVIIGFLLSALISALGCSRQDPVGAGNDPNNKVFPIEVSAVKQTKWVDDISSYGTIKAPDKVEIFPRISGKLVRLLVKEEQQVKNDEVVAIVERDQVGLTFKPVEVQSTVDGRIETIYLKEGAKVNEMSPIMSISKQAELKLVISLFETDLARVKLGQESIITMDALPNQEIAGKVTLIKPTIDALSNKGTVEITLEGTHPDIMFGMFGRVRIVITRRTVLTIVPEAFKRVAGKDAVYTVDNNLAKLVFIEIGARKSDMIEVKSGLSAGQTVITFASDEMKDGSKIKILK